MLVRRLTDAHARQKETTVQVMKYINVVIWVSLFAGSAPAVSDSPETWPKFVQRVLEETFRANPSIAVNAGRHEFDGQFADWSEQGLKAESARLKELIASAQAFQGLDDSQEFERAYVIAVARGQLFWREVADQPHRNPAFYFSNGLDPSVYIARPYAPLEVRLKAYVKYLRGIPSVMRQIKTNLKTPLPLSFINYGKSAFSGFTDYYLGDAKKAFADVKSAELQKELDAASKSAAAAMAEAVVWLENQRATAKEDFQLGNRVFSQMLHDTEMVSTPLADLEKMGWEDLKRNQTALQKECARYAKGESVATCVDKMNRKKPEGGPVAGARLQLPMLKKFLIDRDLVTIPGTEEAHVEEAPAYNRQNSAYIEIPGPYEKGLPSVYYIAPPDPTWKPEVQEAFIPGQSDLLFTSVHEVWPGHFLQFLKANRSKFMWGRAFVGYAFAEGWAHYAEEMMWEAGLGNQDPESHIGQLSNALLRNCRFVSAIAMHSGKMTMEQSKALFQNECFIDEGNAIQQAARGTYDPAYLNYTLGKLEILKLREEWTKKRGGRKAWKEFHDKFLSYGGPPVQLVRDQMLKH